MMTNAADGDFDNVSAKTLTASSSTGGSSLDKSDRGSILADATYQPSIFIRVFVGDFNLTKCLQFPPTTCIWEVKQKLFATLPKDLKDSLNYGLFCPPYNGRAGKFLDDERMLQDYPMPGHVGYLELKYKRRVYKMINLDEKVLKQLHSKANLRKFIDYVLSGQSEKITRLCAKGVDPNFHDLDTGETPLTLATTLKEPAPVLAALVNGGAHLDFRALDGCTALHRAAQQNNLKALQGLLELGSLPNYKDAKGLTPLYYSVTHAKDPSLCELLLHNYAVLGAVDSQGWQEIHQACRYGHIRHLEHLIFYGADIDVRNASGNTPLHTAAVNNQESCARVLLFRGADKYAKNYANQTAFHVAVIGGAIDLSEVIKRHSPRDVVPLREKPKYNPRRRRRSGSPNSTISRASSLNRIGSRSPSFSNGPMATSPSPSSRSYMMFSTTGSLSSNGSNCENSQPSEDCSTSGVVTDKSSCSDESTCTPSMTRGLPPSTGGVAGNNRSSRAQERDDVLLYGHGQRMSVCTEQIRNLNRYSHNSDAVSVKSVPNMRTNSAFSSDSVPPSRDPSPMERGGTGLPRTVTLVRGAQGYGFVLRGSKSGNLTINREIHVVPGEDPPALQYLDEVDRGGPADLAGLRAGDFLLSINTEDVRAYPHEKAVNLIKHAQHTVTLTVMTPPRTHSRVGISKSSSVPNKFRKGVVAMICPPPPRRDPKTALTLGHERSKSYIGLNDIGSNSHDTTTNDSSKIASIRARPVSKRITASEIEELLVRQGTSQSNQNSHSSSNLSSFAPLPVATNSDNRSINSVSSTAANSPATASRVFSSVAQMKRQRAALQQQRRKTDVVSVTSLHKDYHSTPDLSAEGDGCLDGADDDETEELYSDTVFCNGDVYSNTRESAGPYGNNPPQTQCPVEHHNGFRNVPPTPPVNNTYARPINSNASSHKPPPPINRPPANPLQTSHHPFQQTINRSLTRESTQPFSHPTSMKPSQSLDERAYAHIRQSPAQIYATPAPPPAPEDPEPDYFSDEDRISSVSSGRAPVLFPVLKPVNCSLKTSSTVNTTATRMMANPPPPPPPPVTTNGSASSFAAAIAKAAQARQAKVDNCGSGRNPVVIHISPSVNPPPEPPAATMGTSAPPLDGFQSELMRAIQRRSKEREINDSHRSSTDVDTVDSKEQSTTVPSSVKDRITFLERQKVIGPRSVKISGITTDQSSTDLDQHSESGKIGTDLGRNGVNSAGTRAGVNTLMYGTCHNGGSVPVNGVSPGAVVNGGLGCTEIDEGTAVRFGVYRTGRDHDSASINSQSSASTLSSGYESPTLKYGSAGEHVWAHVLQTNDHSPSVSKFIQGFEGNTANIAPPPEFL